MPPRGQERSCHILLSMHVQKHAISRFWPFSSNRAGLSKCRFVIGREKPGEQSEVAQLIQQTLEQERWQREMMEQRYNQYMDEQEVSLCSGVR